MNSNLRCQFAAYSRLTINAWAREVIKNPKAQPKENMSLNDFVDLLERKDIINKDLARQLPQYQINMSYINAKLNNNPMFESNVLSTVASAYEKGMVDYSDHLITKQSVCDKLQKTDVKA